MHQEYTRLPLNGPPPESVPRTAIAAKGDDTEMFFLVISFSLPVASRKAPFVVFSVASPMLASGSNT